MIFGDFEQKYDKYGTIRIKNFYNQKFVISCLANLGFELFEYLWHTDLKMI